MSAPAPQRSPLPLGRCLGTFSERVDVGADEKLIERLIQGRKRAARLLNQEEPPEEDNGAEKKA